MEHRPLRNALPIRLSCAIALITAPLSALGRPMPPKPFPGQLTPPCDPKMERVINGACWVGPIGIEKPPCGPKAFDYEERCYVPSFNAPLTSISGETEQHVMAGT